MGKYNHVAINRFFRMNPELGPSSRVAEARDSGTEKELWHQNIRYRNTITTVERRYIALEGGWSG